MKLWLEKKVVRKESFLWINFNLNPIAIRNHFICSSINAQRVRGGGKRAKKGKRVETKCKCSICLLANIFPGSAFHFFFLRSFLSFSSSSAVLIHRLHEAAIHQWQRRLLRSSSRRPSSRELSIAYRIIQPHSGQVPIFFLINSLSIRFNWEFPMALQDLTHHSLPLLLLRSIDLLPLVSPAQNTRPRAKWRNLHIIL